MSRLKSNRLVSTASVGALLIGSMMLAPAAMAQETSETAVATATPDEVGPDIVVTGTRKRAEDAQTVPIAITALSADEMAKRNISNLADLSNNTPGVAITAIAGGTAQNIYLRGLAPGNTANDLNVDANVGVFIDGIYQTSRNTLDMISVLDVGQIDIAKGPQSALFGRSTFAGAMAISTREPSRNFEGSMSATIGSDEDRRIRASISAPLGDKVSFRVSGGYLKYDGFGTNVADRGDNLGGTEKYAVSAAIKFEPTDNFTAKLSGFLTRSSTEMSAVSVLPLDLFNCGTVNAATGYNTLYCGSLPASKNSDISTNIPNTISKTRQLALELDWELDGVKIVSVTGFTGAENQSNNDYDGTSAGTVFGVCNLGSACVFNGAYTRLVNVNLGVRSLEKVRTFSQEIRLQSDNSSPFQWMFGGNYFNSRIPVSGSGLLSYADGLTTTDRLVQVAPENPTTTGVGAYDFTANPYITQPGVPLYQNLTESSTKTMSIFGSVGYRFGDLRVTAEGRYNIDRKRAKTYAISNPLSQPGFAVPLDGLHAPDATVFPVVSQPYAKTYNAFTPRFTIDYQVTNDIMLYASAAKGVRSGGFNTANPVSATGILADEVSYNQEFNWTYEAGFKSRLFDRRLLLNASFFHVDWTDAQISAFTLNPNAANPVRIVRNAGNIKATGFEAQTEFQLTDMFAVGGSVIYSNPKFQKGAYDGSTITQCVKSDGKAAPGCQVVTIERGNGTTAIVASLEGNRPQRSVKLQWNAYATANIPLNDTWDLTGRVDVSYTGPAYNNQINTSYFGERTLTNARLGFESDKYSVAFWVNNLFNKVYVANSINQPRAGYPFAFSVPEIYLGETRRFGVTASAKF